MEFISHGRTRREKNQKKYYRIRNQGMKMKINEQHVLPILYLYQKQKINCIIKINWNKHFKMMFLQCYSKSMIVLYFKVYFQHVVTDILYHREQQSPPLSTGSGCRTWSGSGWCEDTADCWSSFLISELFLLHMMLSRDQTPTTETRDLRTNQELVIFSLNQSEISHRMF